MSTSANKPKGHAGGHYGPQQKPGGEDRRKVQLTYDPRRKASNMNREALEARLVNLQAQRDEAISQVNAILGAIQDTEWWMKQLDVQDAPKTRILPQDHLRKRSHRNPQRQATETGGGDSHE